jgi:hypothetical protein
MNKKVGGCMSQRSRRVEHIDKNGSKKQQATDKYTNEFPRPFKYSSNYEIVRRKFIHIVDGKGLHCAHTFSERQACPCVAQ